MSFPCHSFSLHQSRPFVVLSLPHSSFYWVSFSLETSNSTLDQWRIISTPYGSSSRICPRSSALHSLPHPLSSFISDSSCGHHLHFDDTQLFISFAASDLSDNILHLQATIGLVSNWMCSNLLSLN